MARYIVDVNLPYHFSLWHGEAYSHLRDIDDSWTDARIWQYARERDLTIISKDSDFSDRVLLIGSPPRVIHIRLGNMRMKRLHQALSKVWPEVCSLSERCRLVNVFEDRLEGIE